MSSKHVGTFSHSLSEWRVECSCGWTEKARTERECKGRLAHHQQQQWMSQGNERVNG